MTISERMFQIMDERGITQYKLSQMTGISTRTISDWRSKKTNPGADKIMMICEALQVSPEALLTGRGRAEVPDSLPGSGLESDIEKQLMNRFRSFSEEKRRRLLAYLIMLENSKE